MQSIVFLNDQIVTWIFSSFFMRNLGYLNNIVEQWLHSIKQRMMQVLRRKFEEPI